MCSTASLASVVMKIWDETFKKEMMSQGLVMDLMLRYVDDCRVFMAPLNEGWEGDGNRRECTFCWERRKMELKEGKRDSERTTEQISRAMCSLVDFLVFTGEDETMFENGRLPTLDVELWIDEGSGKVLHSFYEKPTCPNKVVQKDTALAPSSIRATLTQLKKQSKG